MKPHLKLLFLLFVLAIVGCEKEALEPDDHIEIFDTVGQGQKP